MKKERNRGYVLEERVLTLEIRNKVGREVEGFAERTAELDPRMPTAGECVKG